MEVRPARPAELPEVMAVFAGGLLAVSTDRVRAAIDDDRVLVAADDGPVLAALLLVPADRATRIEAIAVRRGRRGQGIGSMLVRAAAARSDRLVAAFDPAVRPFWASLGFEIAPADEPDRFVGTLDPDPGS